MLCRSRTPAPAALGARRANALKFHWPPNRSHEKITECTSSFASLGMTGCEFLLTVDC